jgi:hypothetical protein
MQTPLQQDDFIILLISIYCFVEDFHTTVLQTIRFSLTRPSQNRPPIKTRNLSVTELVTLALFKQFTGHKTWKSFYRYIKTYHAQDFPQLPEYHNFVNAMNALSPYALILLTAFCAFFRTHTATQQLKIADSTKLAVCNIKREFSHKVCKGLARKSKSTMGWFYGFKLHIVCNQLMQILDCHITAGNVDDRKGLEMIWNYIFGLIVADAGYLGKNEAEKARAQGKILFTAVKANMKKLTTTWQHNLLKARQIIETVFSVLKLRLGIETSLPRSPLGYFAHYIWCLAAYQLNMFWKATAASPMALLA